MRRIFSFLCLTVMILSITTVSLGQGILGSTDLMITPRTNTLVPGELGVAVNFGEGDWSNINFDIGLAIDLEVGLAYYSSDYWDDLTGRIKYRILRESNDSPSLTIGVQDLGADEIAPYLVLSKTFTESGIQGYLGGGGGSFDGIFGGIIKTFKVAKSKNGGQLNQVQLILEGDSNSLNIGAKLGLGKQTTINFGLLDMEQWVLGVGFALK
jgi:hypothetical protein